MYDRQHYIAPSLLVVVCLEGLGGKEQFSFISLVSGSRAGWRRRSRSGLLSLPAGQETASTRSFAHPAWCLRPSPAPPGARRGLCPATRAAGGSSAALGEGWVEDGGCQVCARCLFWGGGGGSCCTELELGHRESCGSCTGRFRSPCSCERSGGCLASAPAKGLEMKMSPCICIQTKAREAAQQPSAGARPPAARVAKQMGCRVLNQLQFLRSCLDNEHHSTQAYRS